MEISFVAVIRGSSSYAAEDRCYPRHTVTSPLKVLSIIGYTRSGSTLLDTILGSIDGFFSTGELHYLWQRGLIEGRLCGCGEPIRSCPVWTNVLGAGFGDQAPEPGVVMRLQDRCARTRHTPRLLRTEPGRTESWPDLDSYVRIVAGLYRGIASATRAHIVVDSSKRPSDGAITRLIPEVEPYVVQLVRDPRAVVHSWARRKHEPDRGGTDEMPRQPTMQSAFGWLELNAMSELVRRRFRDRALLLRYEDLMDDPEASVRRILALVGAPDAATPFTAPREIELRPNHTVSGNPNRFSLGRLKLEPDEAWRGSLPAADHAITTSTTLPLLLRYRYGITRRQPAG